MSDPTSIRNRWLALLTLFVGMGFSACATANYSSDFSLHNPRTAQALSGSQTSLFGPRSGQYRYDKRMIEAAQIAAARAREHSTYSCWRYVKNALLDANLIDSYPKTRYAKEAGDELQRFYGFKRISVPNNDPYRAPEGAVLVYGGKGPGHVEFRTRAGFVSDFISERPCPRPLIGVYIKPKV